MRQEVIPVYNGGNTISLPSSLLDTAMFQKPWSQARTEVMSAGDHGFWNNGGVSGGQGSDLHCCSWDSTTTTLSSRTGDHIVQDERCGSVRYGVRRHQRET